MIDRTVIPYAEIETWMIFADGQSSQRAVSPEYDQMKHELLVRCDRLLEDGVKLCQQYGHLAYGTQLLIEGKGVWGFVWPASKPFVSQL